MASELQVGQSAPLFSLKNHQGDTFSLQDRKGLWTVLYFYPKDNTPGCTKQACAFRDSLSVIRNKNAEVFGISKDTVEKHQKFVQKYHLTFPLLADDKGDVMKAYGVSGFLGLFAKRWTFVIDPHLKITAILRNVDPAMNAQEVSAEIEAQQKSLRP